MSGGCDVGCGFPSVTLLGEKSDWEEILKRLGDLPNETLGDEPVRWLNFLVLYFIWCRNLRTFDGNLC